MDSFISIVSCELMYASDDTSKHSRQTFKKCWGCPNFDRPGEYIRGVNLVIFCIYKFIVDQKRSQILEVILSSAFNDQYANFLEPMSLTSRLTSSCINFYYFWNVTFVSLKIFSHTWPWLITI